MRGLFLTLAFTVTSQICDAAGFLFAEPPGPHAVGFQVVQQYDRSRTFFGRIDPVTGKTVATNPGRPVQTLIWYPAAKAGARVHYGDYIELTGSQDSFERSRTQISAAAEARMRDFIPADMSAATVKLVKDQTMWATRDAAMDGGKYPVVIYAPSFGASAAENADICELLASHGYVVLASASMGARSRWMTQDLDGIETQVADIRFLIGFAATLSDTDNARVAVIGYSWGGIANVFAAAEDSRISALVGFDGGIRLVGKLVAEAKYVTPEHLQIPFLYLASNPGSLEDLYRQQQDLSDDLLARLKYSDLYLITLNPLVHYHFASDHLRFLSTRDAAVFPGDYSMAEINQGYRWVAHYTLAFLDGVLKGNAQSLANLSKAPVAEGLSAHAIKVEVTRAQAAPPSRESMAAELNRRGFSSASDVYDAMKIRNPDFKLFAFEFANWIDALLVLQKPADALALSELFAKTYPKNPWPYEELGESYLASGDKARALENFKRVVAIDPMNERSAAQVKLLEIDARPKGE